MLPAAPWGPAAWPPPLPGAQPSSGASRETDRVLVPPLPLHTEYSTWRFSVDSNVLAASAKPAETIAFLAQVDDHSVGDMQLVTDRDPSLAMLDHKLFAALIGMLGAKTSGEDGLRLLTGIRERCQFGSGRQALRLMDGDFLREGPRRRQRALNELHNLKGPGSLAEIEGHVSKMERCLLELRGSNDYPSDALLITLLRKQLGGQQKLAAVFAQHDLLGGSAQALIEMIKMGMPRDP